MLTALRLCFGRVLRPFRQPVGPEPVGPALPAEKAAPLPDDAEARLKLSAYLAWGIAEGALTQDQAAEEMERFEAELRVKGGPS